MSTKNNSHFAPISNISEIKKAINGDRKFLFKQVGDFTFVCYKIYDSTTFPDPASAKSPEEALLFKLRREARGLVFDTKTGKLLRGIHKFFNIGEREETKIDKIDICENQKYYILEKLDGSMTAPLIEAIDGRQILRFRTKLGYDNDFTQMIEQHIYGHNDISKFPKFGEKSDKVKHQNILDFCYYWVTRGFTPIFEWCSPKAKIILAVIAIRHVEQGYYVSYPEMKKSADQFQITCVQAWEINAKNTKELVGIINKKTGVEGCVLRYVSLFDIYERFEDGRMYKIKSSWYSDIHRCKKHLKWNSLSENHVWHLVLDGKVDDTLPTLDTDEEKKQLQAFNDKLLQAIEKRCVEIENLGLNFEVINNTDTVAEAKKLYKDKKQFANYAKSYDRFLQQILFKVYSGTPSEDAIISALRQALSKKLEIARTILGDTSLKFEFFDRGQVKSRKKEVFIDKETVNK